MPKLGVNIDHIATLRQARRGFDPDPIKAALLCEQAGADSIVAHLREDRRHIQDPDLFRLKKTLKIPLNMEMSINPDIVQLACKLRPPVATLVPERRKELTTEGGLDVARNYQRLKNACRELMNHDIAISLFIAAEKLQIQKSADLGVAAIELHTGEYDHATTTPSRQRELKKLTIMTQFARSLGLRVNAGHGLKYHNTAAIAKIPGIEELNIGHSIISYAVLVGLKQAVREMKKIVRG